MKKREALNFIKKEKGYVPYIILFELYNDEDNIPQELINISLKKDIAKGNFIICSSPLAKQLEKL